MADENKALIERMVSSKWFAGAPGLGRLLKFLAENQHRKLYAKEIEDEHYGFPEGSLNHNPAHTRERISKLKAHIDTYNKEAVNEQCLCELPESARGEGYQLRFEPRKKSLSATQRFWKSHVEMVEDVLVVCASHLFLFEPSRSTILRYYDFNVDKSRTETLDALKVAHPEGYKPTLQPWHDPYLSTGEVHAYESLLRGSISKPAF